MTTAKKPIGTAKTKGPPPRERLLAAADELFYAHGVHVVGVDRILVHAGVAKASMYSAFANKEELVAAYLQSRHERVLGRLHEAVDQHTDPRLRLLAVFDVQSQWISNPAYHGCAFARATAEIPAGALMQQAVDDYRSDILVLLTRLAADAGAIDPSALALQLQLIYHGASILKSSQHPMLPIVLSPAVRALLDAAIS